MAESEQQDIMTGAAAARQSASWPRRIVGNKGAAGPDAVASGHSHPDDTGTIIPGPKDDREIGKGRTNNIVTNENVVIIEKVGGQYRVRVLEEKLTGSQARTVQKNQITTNAERKEQRRREGNVWRNRYTTSNIAEMQQMRNFFQAPKIVLFLAQLFLVFLLLEGCASSADQEAAYSVENVLQNAGRLDSETIVADGYFVFEFEDHNLYQSRRAFREGNDAECVSLELKKSDIQTYQRNNKRNVVVRGTVDSDFCTANDICPASCNEIGLTDIEILTSK